MQKRLEGLLKNKLKPELNKLLKFLIYLLPYDSLE